MIDRINKIKKLGFTLVELMVVVAVMIILTGIGAASLNKINSNQELNGLKNELIASFNLARSMAITNQLPTAMDNDSLKFVLVTMAIGGSVKVDAITAGGNTVPYFSKNNNSITTNSIFGFSIENGRLTNNTGVLVDDPLCFTLYLNKDPDDKKYLFIDTTGLIYEKNNCN